MMDILILILLIIVVNGMVVFDNRRKKSQSPDFIPVPQNTEGEMESLEEMMTSAVEKAERAFPSSDCEKENQLSQKNTYRPVVTDTEPVSQIKKPKKESKPAVEADHRIHLHTRSEARKAFLYAEIFNRKYKE